MNTFVLSPETARSPIETLLSQSALGSVAVLDGEGNVVAFVLSPVDREAWIYQEADRELERNRSTIEARLKRRGGVTTQQMLANARAAATQADARL